MKDGDPNQTKRQQTRKETLEETLCGLWKKMPRAYILRDKEKKITGNANDMLAKDRCAEKK